MLTRLGVEFVVPLHFHRIGLGQSNLTYRVTDEAGSAWVLRRPPLGPLLASAHDVEREARIMAALEDTDVPVPRILGVTAASESSAVPLVLMEFVDGLVVDTMEVAGALTPSQRRQIALSLPRTLAKIHAVDLAKVGLEDLASRKPYAQRQLKRWAGQWELSKTRELPELDELTRRLTAAIPEQHEIRLVHGDFHLRNLVTSPQTGEVVATLDWELSTLGDPLADMGTLLTYWPEPGETMGGDFAPSTLLGFPDRAEMARLYVEASGRDAATLQYWHVLGLWKLAIIAEGVMRRAIEEPQNQGAAGTPTLERIDTLVHKALEIAGAAGI
ncbi:MULTISPECIES: phosphotransferase family protein [unclassified Mycobacterium]|uniref:phosphotransferase family protein n=1 Tax=unclassified Mycobacterium TaxID=2642494 RepID=UPI00073FC952|nr:MULTISPECIES: phosphotransferase family protein [unclassified Mycobacterium]KUH85875.1 aminoglycoside phosphotransferase [Mycobacterium sp. GA-1999]KUH91733.1 aminoglycoside phosphotransferase [Mycobacterium sp. GA-0227b]KUH96551.1 aminoglycoside phosphotransferase [Mycobacterium sp. IS-1556]